MNITSPAQLVPIHRRWRRDQVRLTCGICGAISSFGKPEQNETHLVCPHCVALNQLPRRGQQ